MTSAAEMLEPFAQQRAVLLTTYRRDRTPVGTAVNIAVDGDHAYIRTYDRAGKAKRLRNNPSVEIAPSTFRGKPIGPAIQAQMRLLDGEEAKIAARALAHKYRILQGILVPLSHRLARYKTLHYEVTLMGPSVPAGAR